MKQLLAIAIAVAVAWALAVLPALAAPQTVTLSVLSMYCAACPITVKKALSRVEGVSKVETDFAKKEVTVSFDDAKANVEVLTKAPSNAGFPSTPKR